MTTIQTLRLHRTRVLELYARGESAAKISQKLLNRATYTHAVLRLLRENGVNPRTYSEASRKYVFDDSIFESVDSPEKAYWLGFIIADGSIFTKKNSLKIELAVKDSQHLYSFSKFLKSSLPVNFYRNGSSAQVCVVSQKIVEDLAKFGIIQNKSFTVRVPSLPSFLRSHLWRGIFDGDGWISVNMKRRLAAGVCGNIHVMSSLSEFLWGLGIPNSVYPHKSIYRVQLYAKRAHGFLKAIYENETVSLERKKLKFKMLGVH